MVSEDKIHDEIACRVGRVKYDLNELLDYISALKLTKKVRITTREDLREVFKDIDLE